MKLIAGVIALSLLAGCTNMTRLPAMQSGDTEQLPQFNLVTDIPIPAGSSMDNDRSLVLSDRDRWTGRVVIRMWKAASESTAFYQQQMPAFGWEPVMSASSDVSVLTYTRGDRAATVQIERSNVWGSTVLVTAAARQSYGASSSGASTYTPVYSQPVR